MQQGSFVKVLPLLFLTYELYSMCQNNDECINDIKINRKIVPKFVGFFVNFFGSKLSFNKAVSMVVSWPEGFFVRVATRYASSPIVFWCMITKPSAGSSLRYTIFCVPSTTVGVKIWTTNYSNLALYIYRYVYRIFQIYVTALNSVQLEFFYWLFGFFKYEFNKRHHYKCYYM